MTKRVIPPIMDYVDPRRVPYNIMDDPRYNPKHPDYKPTGESGINRLFEEMDQREAERSWWEKGWWRVRYTWRNRIRYWLRPSTYAYRIGGKVARMRRGWGEWDLDQFTPHVLEYMMAACDWHATKSWTYPAGYVDDPNWPENTSPDRGRGVEGYREDLMRMKSGFQHLLAIIQDNEKCSCCGDWCDSMECPIVAESWDLYRKLFMHMWD